MTYYNQYRAKAIQNQQKSQPNPETRQASKSQRQQRQPRQQEDKPRDFGGFDSLIVGRECVIKLGNGEAIKGVVSATSKYFYLVTAGGQVVIINKAYVVTIMPVQSQNKNEDAGTPIGAVAAIGEDYGERKQ
jgi:sRNA-binding regulator protein Hfq